jgi:hypothetical protein
MPLSIPLDVAKLPAPVQRIVGPAAPPPMRTMAARGMAPGLKPEQIVTVVVLFALGDLPHVDDATRDQARQTLAKLPPPVVNGALASPDLPASVVDVIAEAYVGDAAIVEKIVLHPAVAVDTIVKLAKTGGEAATELVAVNEERLLANPGIIEALYMNKKTRMSTADRVLDLAVRNGKTLSIPAFKEAAQAILDELVITEPLPEATPDDVLFVEAHKIAEAIDAAKSLEENIFKEDDEGNEELEEKAKPLEQRIRDMTVSQKIRTAMLGTAAARALLVRDKNRLVAASVVRSPLIQEMELAQFSASRSVSEDVLRIIGTNGDLSKSHTVKFNLVANPKTPMAVSMRMLVHLRSDELKKLAKSKNVSGQISRMARQELEKKRPGT